MYDGGEMLVHRIVMTFSGIQQRNFFESRNPAGDVCHGTKKYAGRQPLHAPWGPSNQTTLVEEVPVEGHPPTFISTDRLL